MCRFMAAWEPKLRRRISVFGHVTFCSPAIV